ncbi:MAG: Ig-like domain-containing protein, partial [Gemmatimonadaceae bacterium]
MTRFSSRATLRFAFVCAAVVAGLTACDRDNGTSPKNNIPTEIQAMAWPDSMIAGQAVTFRAMVLDQHGDTVSGPQLHWTNSAPTVLSIQTLANGDSIRVTAVRPGSALVTVDVVGANDSVHATGTVHVTLAGARITTPDGASNLPALGSQLVISARALGFDAAMVDSTGLIWTHSADSVVSIDTFAGSDSATVTAARYGTDTVTVTAPSCDGECSTQLVVSVGHAVASVAVTPTLDTLHTVGATQQLSPAAYRADSTLIDGGVAFTWASSDSSVATVDSTGLVTAVNAGSANIYAFGEGVQSNAAVIQVSLLGGPTAGGDVVVFSDVSMFQNAAIAADSNNAVLVRNLVSYT